MRDQINAIEFNQSMEGAPIGDINSESDQVNKFISEFSHRLQALTNQMQTVQTNQSIDMYKVTLESQLTGFLSLNEELAWMGVLLDKQEVLNSKETNSTSISAMIKECYTRFTELSKDCIQDHIKCLQGNIFLVEQQIQMLNSRPQLNYDLDPEPTEVDIHLLSNASQNVTPSAPPLDELDSYLVQPSAPPLELIQQQNNHFNENSEVSFLECIDRNLGDDVVLNQDGSINLSEIKSRLADTVINTAAGMFYIDCPVSFESFYSGDAMYILYDSNEYNSIEDVLSNPDLKFHLYSQSAIEWAIENKSDPLTRKKVDSACKVIINESSQMPFVSQANSSNIELAQSIRGVKECSNKLSDLFEDMFENVEYYKHQLEGLTTELTRYDSSQLESLTADTVMNKLNHVNKLQLELSKNYEDTALSAGAFIETNLLMSQLSSFSKNTEVLIESFNKIVESGLVQQLNAQCNQIASTISTLDVDYDVHSELLLEIKSSNFLTLKLVSQIEDQINTYKFLIVKIRSFTDSSQIKSKLLADCEFEINRLEKMMQVL